MSDFRFLFCIYSFFCILFLAFIGIDAYEGRIDFQFYADTTTYLKLYKLDFSLSQLASLNFNLLGPLVMLKLVGGNYYLILIINLIVLYKSMSLLSSNFDINIVKVFLLTIFAPLTIGSIIGINKEIFSLLVISYLLVFMRSKMIKYFIYAFLFSFFVRWQLALVVLISGFSLLKINPFRKKPWYTIFFLLISISIFYPYNLTMFEHVDNVAKIGAENTTEGSGIFSMLISIQNKILGYVVVFWPKALFLLGGLIFRFQNIFDTRNLYNNFFVTLQCFFNVYLLYKSFKLKLSIDNLCLYIGLIYLIIFCISPIYAPRYLFPIYFLMSILLSFKKSYIHE